MKVFLMKLVFDESGFDEFVLYQRRNQMWSSVFGNANLSDLSETLFEGNKDHLLNYARTDLTRREIHVESVNKCIGHLQNERRSKAGHHRTCKHEFVESH